MSEFYFTAISDEIIREKLGLDEETEIEYRFTDRWRTTDITIFFTGATAGWIAKYKGEYYGSLVSNIVEQDRYTYIDVFKTLRENALATLKAL